MPQENPKSAVLTLAEVSRIAQELLLSSGSHAPTVIAEGSRQTVVARLEPFAPTHEQRAQQMFLLGLALAQSGEVGVLQQVFFIAEAWLSIHQPSQPLQHSPSQDPERQEVVIIAHHTLQPVNAEMVVFEMKRDEQGTLKVLEPLHPQEPHPEDTVRSPLVEALLLGFLGSHLLPND